MNASELTSIGVSGLCHWAASGDHLDVPWWCIMHECFLVDTWSYTVYPLHGIVPDNRLGLGGYMPMFIARIFIRPNLQACGEMGYLGGTAVVCCVWDAAHVLRLRISWIEREEGP